jgi:uncharacterized protein (DUF433 family)
VGLVFLKVSSYTSFMALPLAAEPVPLASDADGVLRVGGTRVTLDSLVAAFEEGATAEEIAQQYPSLTLAQIYAVIAYYLGRREEVAEYLGHRRDEASRVRRENVARSDPRGLRERLVARRSSSGS